MRTFKTTVLNFVIGPSHFVKFVRESFSEYDIWELPKEGQCYHLCEFFTRFALIGLNTLPSSELCNIVEAHQTSSSKKIAYMTLGGGNAIELILRFCYFAYIWLECKGSAHALIFYVRCKDCYFVLIQRSFLSVINWFCCFECFRLLNQNPQSCRLCFIAT